MTNQQAPEIYTLHTVPNKGERPWSGIYTVRADAEHDAKVMRDVTGRHWSVVRLVVADTATTPTGPVARYKIGYHTDDWGVRSSSPSGIPDPAGAWVRYEDHAAVITALRIQQPAPATQKLKEQICISDTNQSAACAVGSVGTTSDAQTTRPTHDAPDSVLEDAARWQWLADYLIGERTDLDEGIVACATIDALRQFADAARKQGGAT